MSVCQVGDSGVGTGSSRKLGLTIIRKLVADPLTVSYHTQIRTVKYVQRCMGDDTFRTALLVGEMVRPVELPHLNTLYRSR